MEIIRTVRSILFDNSKPVWSIVRSAVIFPIAAKLVLGAFCYILEGFLPYNAIYPSTGGIYKDMPVYLMLLFAVFIAPILEELFFREILYGRIMTGILHLNRYLSMATASLLFALYHGNVYQALYAFVAGMYLAFLYDRKRSLVYPLLFHMGSNAVSLILELVLFLVSGI